MTRHHPCQDISICLNTNIIFEFVLFSVTQAMTLWRLYTYYGQICLHIILHYRKWVYVCMSVNVLVYVFIWNIYPFGVHKYTFVLVHGIVSHHTCRYVWASFLCLSVFSLVCAFMCEYACMHACARAVFRVFMCMCVSVYKVVLSQMLCCHSAEGHQWPQNVCRNSNMYPLSFSYTYVNMGSAKKQIALHWRHNNYDGVSNHQPTGCLLNRLFRRRSKKTSKLRVTGLCAGNSPGPVNSPHKGPVTRKMFPFEDVIMGWVSS